MDHSSNTQCVLYLLKTYGPSLTTAQIIEHASKHPELCKGCKSGGQVITTCINLTKTGILERDTIKGGFVWKIKHE